MIQFIFCELLLDYVFCNDQKMKRFNCYNTNYVKYLRNRRILNDNYKYSRQRRQWLFFWCQNTKRTMPMNPGSTSRTACQYSRYHVRRIIFCSSLFTKMVAHIAENKDAFTNITKLFQDSSCKKPILSCNVCCL